MPASPLDSAIYRGLFGDDEVSRLFSDSAEIRAMLMVEGALARVQGDLALIPEAAAAFLHRATLDVVIDPAALGPMTAQNGVPLTALVSAFRASCGAPDLAAWMHWGATSQDIVDSALMLRLRRVLAILADRLDALLDALADRAIAFAHLPMAGRTFGQNATPTTFGAVIAGWGRPLCRHRRALRALAPEVLCVSLSGAAGTLGAMGARGPEVRAGLALALGLADPGAGWHAERDRIGRLAAWMAGLTTSLGKMGEDMTLLAQTGIAELSTGGGASSTMPQKQNPVGPAVIVTLAHLANAMSGALQGAGLHRQQRDGAAWFTEWMCLPQLCIATARAITLAQELCNKMVPDSAQMENALAHDGGLILAEALSFALSETMPRPAAKDAVTELCADVRRTGRTLAELAAERWPDVDWAARLSLGTQLGTAPADALAFAAQAKADKA